MSNKGIPQPRFDDDMNSWLNVFMNFFTKIKQWIGSIYPFSLFIDTTENFTPSLVNGKFIDDIIEPNSYKYIFGTPTTSPNTPKGWIYSSQSGSLIYARGKNEMFDGNPDKVGPSGSRQHIGFQNGTLQSISQEIHLEPAIYNFNIHVLGRPGTYFDKNHSLQLGVSSANTGDTLSPLYTNIRNNRWKKYSFKFTVKEAGMHKIFIVSRAPPDKESTLFITNVSVIKSGTLYPPAGGDATSAPAPAPAPVPQANRQRRRPLGSTQNSVVRNAARARHQAGIDRANRNRQSRNNVNAATTSSGVVPSTPTELPSMPPVPIPSSSLAFNTPYSSPDINVPQPTISYINPVAPSTPATITIPSSIDLIDAPDIQIEDPTSSMFQENTDTSATTIPDLSANTPVVTLTAPEVDVGTEENVIPVDTTTSTTNFSEFTKDDFANSAQNVTVPEQNVNFFEDDGKDYGDFGIDDIVNAAETTQDTSNNIVQTDQSAAESAAEAVDSVTTAESFLSRQKRQFGSSGGYHTYQPYSSSNNAAGITAMPWTSSFSQKTYEPFSTSGAAWVSQKNYQPFSTNAIGSSVGAPVSRSSHTSHASPLSWDAPSSFSFQSSYEPFTVTQNAPKRSHEQKSQQRETFTSVPRVEVKNKHTESFMSSIAGWFGQKTYETFTSFDYDNIAQYITGNPSIANNKEIVERITKIIEEQVKKEQEMEKKNINERGDFSNSANLPLKEYAIKSSYHSAYDGKSVSLDALKQNMLNGNRFIDLQVFMATDDILYVGYTEDDTTFMIDKTLPLHIALNYISSYAFVKDNKQNVQESDSPNLYQTYTDFPLILNLRIHRQIGNSRVDIIGKIYNECFKGDGIFSKSKLLLRDNKAVQVNKSTMMNEVKGKIIVSMDINNILKYYTTSNDAMEVPNETKEILENMVNIKTGGHTWKSFTDYSNIAQTPQYPLFNKDNGYETNTKNMYIIFPSVSNKYNPDSVQFMKNYKIQTIPIRHWLKDDGQKSTTALFNFYKSPFVPMRNILIYANQ